jgi:hypothetical protein
LSVKIFYVFNLLPGYGSAWIRIHFQSWIRIRIRLKSWIRIRIKSETLPERSTGHHRHWQWLLYALVKFHMNNAFFSFQAASLDRLVLPARLNESGGNGFTLVGESGECGLNIILLYRSISIQLLEIL